MPDVPRGRAMLAYAVKLLDGMSIADGMEILAAQVYEQNTHPSFVKIAEELDLMYADIEDSHRLKHVKLIRMFDPLTSTFSTKLCCLVEERASEDVKC